jgi:hypothetical protein
MCSKIPVVVVSPEESGQLCMLACLLSSAGDVFFPKLDESYELMCCVLIKL